MTLAMNGWGEGQPAWWLNLMAHPDARVELKDSSQGVRARAAEADERERLWAKWRDFSKSAGDLDSYAAMRIVQDRRRGPRAAIGIAGGATLRDTDRPKLRRIADHATAWVKSRHHAASAANRK